MPILLDAEPEPDSNLFRPKGDSLITPIGNFLRRDSLDELPQIFNVLRGEMSLVGPRPPVPKEVERYTVEDRQRLQAKPGLTCLWQIGGRSEIVIGAPSEARVGPTSRAEEF